VHQALIGRADQLVAKDQPRLQRIAHRPLVEHGRRAHGVVPVHVPEHLVLREQQGLEGRDTLLVDAQLETRRCGITHDRERMQQTIDIHLAVRHAAEARVALEVLDLVEIQAAADQALQRTVRDAADQGVDTLGCAGRDCQQDSAEVLLLQEAADQCFVMPWNAIGVQLLEGMGEGVMPDVVEQRGERYQPGVERVDEPKVATPVQHIQGAAGQVVHADRVIEAGVGCAGVDEVTVTELLDVAQPLKSRQVDDQSRRAFDADRIPERVPDGNGGCHAGRIRRALHTAIAGAARRRTLQQRPAPSWCGSVLSLSAGLRPSRPGSRLPRTS
jgi:hypothetical protein